MTAVERLVSRILWWGGVASIALMLIGLAGYAARVDIRGDGFQIPATSRAGSGRPSAERVRVAPPGSSTDCVTVRSTHWPSPRSDSSRCSQPRWSRWSRRSRRSWPRATGIALISTFLALALIGSLLLGGAG